MSYDSFLALGRVNPYDPREGFCMTVLALKCCHRANAVSSLHGQVSRAMWTPLFPGVREEIGRASCRERVETGEGALAATRMEITHRIPPGGRTGRDGCSQ